MAGSPDRRNRPILHAVSDNPSAGGRAEVWRSAVFDAALRDLYDRFLDGAVGTDPEIRSFCAGVDAVGRPQTSDVLAAGHRAINGLFKAFLIAPVFLKASDLQALTAPGADWLDFAIVFYSYPIYIYLNFSGYTDFMIAIARLCGVITLPENFNRPYLARNLLDFWGRWHISFGTWIRTYVFTPLSTALISPVFAEDPYADACADRCRDVHHRRRMARHDDELYRLRPASRRRNPPDRPLRTDFEKRSGPGNPQKFEGHPAVHAIAVIVCFHYVAATILLFPNSVADLTEVLGQFLSNMQ